MKFKLNFNLSAWIEGVEIEATDEDEAKRKLYSMDVSDMLEYGIIRESDVDEVETEVVSTTYDVEIFNIDYDLDDEEESLGDQLPKSVLATIKVDTADGYTLDDLVADEVTYQTNVMVNSCDYKVIKKY